MEEDDDDEDEVGGEGDLLQKDPLSDDEEEGMNVEDMENAEDAKDDSPKEGEKSEAEEPLSEKEKCRRFIEEIRRDDFGVGVEMSDTAAKLVAVQQVGVRGMSIFE